MCARACSCSKHCCDYCFKGCTCHLSLTKHDSLQSLSHFFQFPNPFVVLSNSKLISPAELQQIAADMFQMEAALFVPSGTMSNLIAGELALCWSIKLHHYLFIYFINLPIVNVMMTCHYAVMAHCRERGDEIIVGDLSHMHIYEQGGCAQVSSPPDNCSPSSYLSNDSFFMLR